MGATLENVPAPARSAGETRQTPVPRVASLDAFRGLVMSLMLAEALRLPQIARSLPDSSVWSFIAFHTSHVEWEGGSLHDLIQPGFSFLVGAALPFSIAARRSRGQTFWPLLGHAIWRSIALILLGIFLRSLGKPQTNFTFEDTLTQIGLGYVFLFLLGFAPLRGQVIALAVFLLGYWLAFAIYPAPGQSFDYSKVGVQSGWPHHYQGFESHWDKNSNLAWAFDTWFLNLFPREAPFEYNRGGYATLSFIPTLGTMILGLLTGRWLQTGRTSKQKLQGLALSGVVLIVAALVWQFSGTGPIVKRIWTPSFTLYSGGWVLLILSGFYALMEVRGWQRWAFPLVVVGMNSIAAYLMSWTLEEPVVHALKRHLGSFSAFGVYAPLALGAMTLALFWLALYWMYRRRVFLRI